MIELTDPADEIVTLAAAKLHLRVDHTAEDAAITTMIQAARVALEKATRRALVRRTFRLSLPGFPSSGEAIELPMPPLVSVDLVKYRTTAGAWVEIDDAELDIDTMSLFGRVAPLSGSWPETGPYLAPVLIDITAGYEVPPAPLVHAALLTITDLYEVRGATGDKAEINPTVAALVSPYALSVLIGA